MIHTIRLTKPHVLVEKQMVWTEELCLQRKEYYEQLERFNNNIIVKKPGYPDAIKSRYAHQQIKDQLKNMFGIKCAYCESPVDGASYQHVEHFRPQSIYPKLAYEWDNLLLVCEKCNSHHKKEKFPLRNGEQPTENLRDPCLLDASDDNLLVNPCQDDPINFFTFKDEYIVCKNQRAQVSRMTYGLDREALNDQRKKHLYLIETAALAYIFALRQGNLVKQNQFSERIKQVLNPLNPYIAATRAKLEDLGINLSDLE